MTQNEAYLMARRKIKEAKHKEAKKLYIGTASVKNSDNPSKLAEIPELLGGLTQLRELSIKRHDLKRLPEWFGNLKNLQSLDISYGQLEELPKSFSNLIQLQSLNLSNNQLAILPESLGQLTQLQNLNLSNNQLTELPESLERLTRLENLHLHDNKLTELPSWLGQLSGIKELLIFKNKLMELPISLSKLCNLQKLRMGDNPLTENIEELDWRLLGHLEEIQIDGINLTKIPAWVKNITSLKQLIIDNNQISDISTLITDCPNLIALSLGGSFPLVGGNPIKALPEDINRLTYLKFLSVSNCELTDLPSSLAQLEHLEYLKLDNNPLNSELAEAYKQGLDAVKLYLRAGAVIPTYEAKLVIVGEGEVGKSCLLSALRDEPFVQGLPTTHGIQIKPIILPNPRSKKEITLNGWDFGGQRVYRPTHQLFFSAPAVYLVVWKPREGPQQGFVKEWIKLVKHREPSAKILVVATHGGPQQRQPDIDRQELWDLFGKETIVDFFFVDSKPDAYGQRKGIEELKRAIARVAADLPEVGRSVPKSFADVRAALQARNVPYLPLDEVLAICRAHHMDDEIARLYLTISHRLGHLTHYQHDPQLRDIVILRPDWLATAMSYVLDDEATRGAHGLVKFSRLNHLWDDPTRGADSRYAPTLHPIFLRLMERFDLSYRVADSSPRADSDPQSLIAQLVPDNRPENFAISWLDSPSSGDLQQTQICRIVDNKGNTAAAEGLFYQLIVRLHKYSLGRVDYTDSVHWQRGLVLDDDYNGRALLEHKANDVHITVRAPYPERFLAMLTEEVRYLVESFWEGLRCDVMVPCLKKSCIGLFEVSKLIENKRRGRPEQPCPVCNEWQDITKLLNNAPAATPPISLDVLMKEFAQVKDTLSEVNVNTQRILSQVDKQFADLIQLYTDEAKEGPRLFSLFPLDGNKFNPQTWVREKFRLVLWCEHSRLPLPAINGMDSKKGIYDLEFDREWFKRAVPFLKFMTGTLSLVLPVMSSTLKVVNDTAFKTLESQLGLGKNVIDAIAGEGTKLGDVMDAADEATTLERGVGIRADNATLRELHALLKAKDPGFGGLVRVMNKRQEFLWVHERFAEEY